MYIITGYPTTPMRQPAEPPFCCPLCGSDSYVDVHVRRPNGDWYRTSFFKCFGCAVMFHDPLAFTQQNRHVRDPGAMGGGHGRGNKN